MLQSGALSAQSQPEPIEIKSIYFGGGSYWITAEQAESVLQLIDSIPHIEQYFITIHSHTDNIGGAAYNQWLSKMRSRSVMQLLSLREFPAFNMEVQDFGLFNPLFDNSTVQGRQKNRRVDVIVWPPPL